MEEAGVHESSFNPGKPLWKLILEQFDDLLVKILLTAAVISFVSYCEEPRTCINTVL